MARWINVLDADALEDGTHCVVPSPAGKLIVFRRGASFFVLEDVCSHDGGELGTGACEGDEIICPRHGARFCVRTGAVLTAPAYEDVESFSVQVVAGKVQVDIG